MARVKSLVISDLPLQSAIIVTEPHCDANGEIEEHNGGDSIQPIHRDEWQVKATHV